MHALFAAVREVFVERPWLVAGFSLGSLALSVLLLVGAVVAFPPDYFEGTAPPPTRHPAWTALLFIGKNVLGVLFVALGVILSIPGVPGQGFLTIAIGLLLLDLPKKRALERRLLQSEQLRGFINRIRRAFRRPPMRFRT